jgi:xylulose-5-phosphate/fructose-6-phosphate phosphoketolase
VLARIPRAELKKLLEGYGHKPYFIEGDDPAIVHQQLADTLDTIMAEIRNIQRQAREEGFKERPAWPMIVFATPKGWTGPDVVDDKDVEGTWRAHQVPLAELAKKPEHVRLLERWMKGYAPEKLFDAQGRLVPELAALAPQGTRRMGATPYANGGLLMRDLVMPLFEDHALEVTQPGTTIAGATMVFGKFLRDVMRTNISNRNFRIMGPDETASNRLSSVFEVTGRMSSAEILESDEHISPEGRVMEILSEHACQGWLEGYLLTGRHGLFSCYEAFIHIVDSMFNQHAKWLHTCGKIPWRQPIASLNYLLTSHVWRQDHNGNSHQDPGFLDLVANKTSDIVRIYLPPDANTLLSVADHCLRSYNYVNVIVAGKQPELQWMDMPSAILHCEAGMGVWPWAGTTENEPDVVMACAGDVPTMETMAAVEILRDAFPDLKIRVVNVVDLMCLQPRQEHSHGWSDEAFDGLFTADKPVIFAFHGYPTLIHRLTYKRTNHRNLHVHGYKGEGTTTTPFDMVVMNELDRYRLAIDAVRRVSMLGSRGEKLIDALERRLKDHLAYIKAHGEDPSAISDWKFSPVLSDQTQNH